MQQSFKIQQVRAENDHIRQTVFVLDQQKKHDGEFFDQIVFTGNERADLKELLLKFFEGSSIFDFDVKRGVGPGQCEIHTVYRSR